MSRAAENLQRYRQRRDFGKTPEPKAGPARRREGREPLFVIQRHDASRLHFDFRLEAGGVLKSWAVPKGPSTDPRDRRLAVRTEDHPLEYAKFEGVIPKGEYGGGSVIVWDAGTYRNMSTDDRDRPVSIEDAIDGGVVKLWLEGQKLRGGYVLVHSRMSGKDENWLLIKEQDEGADARRRPISTQPASVLSGRTNREVEQEGSEDDG